MYEQDSNLRMTYQSETVNARGTLTEPESSDSKLSVTSAANISQMETKIPILSTFLKNMYYV